ncbi:MAG: DUF4386 family protein [Fibrobacteria bacterium]|nr:DUF4386 family protein [Fibrobacteria bacterium]
MELRHAGGLSALLLATLLLCGLTTHFLWLDTSALPDEMARLSFHVQHHGAFRTFALALYVVYGILQAILSLALWRHLGLHAPDRSLVATSFGLMWSILLVGSGLVFMVGLDAVARLATTDPQAALPLLRTVEVVHEGLGCSLEIPGGLWFSLTGWTFLASPRPPRILAWSAVAIGVAGVLSAFPPLYVPAVGAFALGSIPVLARTGFVLLGRGSASS